MQGQEDMQGVKRCGAKTRSGAPCKGWAMANGRCRMHRGKAAKGPAHGAYKTGKYSKYLRGDLLAKYEEALSDRRLTLIDDIAVTDARVASVMDQMGGDSLLETWKGMARKAGEIKRDEPEGVVAELVDMVLSGFDDAKRWQEITQLQEHKRKLVDSENRASAIAERSISAEEFVYRIRQLTEVIKDVVDDRRTLNNITSAIERTVLGRGTGRPTA